MEPQPLPDPQNLRNWRVLKHAMSATCQMENCLVPGWNASLVHLHQGHCRLFMWKSTAGKTAVPWHQSSSVTLHHPIGTVVFSSKTNNICHPGVGQLQFVVSQTLGLTWMARNQGKCERPALKPRIADRWANLSWDGGGQERLTWFRAISAEDQVATRN